MKGHASQRKEPHEFTWAETLNEAADAFATAARETTHLPDADTYHWPEQQVSVRGDCGQLRGNLAKELRYCCTQRDLATYYQSRYEWSDQILAYLDMAADDFSTGMLVDSPNCRCCRSTRRKCRAAIEWKVSENEEVDRGLPSGGGSIYQTLCLFPSNKLLGARSAQPNTDGDVKVKFDEV